jgi:hypothetical protein
LVQKPHPAERRSFGHDIDGKKTLVVCASAQRARSVVRTRRQPERHSWRRRE